VDVEGQLGKFATKLALQPKVQGVFIVSLGEFFYNS
jgi:hypothetical protein